MVHADEHAAKIARFLAYTNVGKVGSEEWTVVIEIQKLQLRMSHQVNGASLSKMSLGIFGIPDSSKTRAIILLSTDTDSPSQDAGQRPKFPVWGICYTRRCPDRLDNHWIEQSGKFGSENCHDFGSNKVSGQFLDNSDPTRELRRITRTCSFQKLFTFMCRSQQVNACLRCVMFWGFWKLLYRTEEWHKPLERFSEIWVVVGGFRLHYGSILSNSFGFGSQLLHVMLDLRII